MKIKIWVFSVLGISALLLGSMALPHSSVKVGQTYVAWGLEKHWELSSRSGYVIDWDEPARTTPPQPPCQYYQQRSEHFGPFVVESNRRISPQFSPVCR